jgi:hypothetical protein
MAVLLLPGNAQPGDVLAGKSFSAGANYGAVGSMPENGAVILTPSGAGNVPIPAGHHNGAGYVQQVNVPAANVLSGTTIAGVPGTMPNRGAPTFTPGTNDQGINPGYYSGGVVKGDPNLIASNILSGKTIFGVTGSVASKQQASGTVTSSSAFSSFLKQDGINSYSCFSITVSGLTFRPSVIICYCSNDTVIYRDTGDWGASPSPIVTSSYTSGYVSILIREVSPVSITSTGFTLPCAFQNTIYRWIAVA